MYRAVAVELASRARGTFTLGSLVCAAALASACSSGSAGDTGGAGPSDAHDEVVLDAAVGDVEAEGEDAGDAGEADVAEAEGGDAAADADASGDATDAADTACAPDCAARECGFDPICHSQVCGFCVPHVSYCDPTGACASIVGSVAVTPATASVLTGRRVAFSAAVAFHGGTGDDSVAWTVLEPGGGTVTPSGVYGAPAASGTWHVVAKSVLDPTVSGSAAIAVHAPDVQVVVGPSLATTAPGGTYCFEAYVKDADDQRVTWAASDASLQSLGDGCFVAPTTAGSYTLSATSAFDPAKVASATLKVVAGAQPFNVEAGYAVLASGGSANVYAQAQVQPKVAFAVVEGASGGAVSAGGYYDFPLGTYVAPTTPGIFHVRITLTNDPRVVVEVPMLVGEGSVSTALATALPQASSCSPVVTKLADGRVLVIGAGSDPAEPDVSLLDPVTGKLWSGHLPTAGVQNMAVAPLADGHALIVGGRASSTSVELASAWTFDPGTDAFTPVGPMNVARAHHWAVTLADGSVLVGGGTTPTLESFDPGTQAFTLLDTPFEPVWNSAVVLMDDGRVLTAGGTTPGVGERDSLQIYDPKTGAATTFLAADTGCSLHGGTVAIRLGGDRYALVGAGCAWSSCGPTVDLFDVGAGRCTGRWTVYPSGGRRTSAAAAPLGDGRVAILGGSYGDFGNAATMRDSAGEIFVFDPDRGTLRTMGHLRTSQMFGECEGGRDDGAVLLDDRRVLVVGGLTWETKLPMRASGVSTFEAWLP